MITASHHNNLPDAEFENYLRATLTEARNKPLPTNDEIHIKIVDVLWGDISVSEFREWLVERFR